MEDINARVADLERTLRARDGVCIAFSGGVDSTFLAAVCARCMPERTLLIHAATPLIATPEARSYEREAAALGLPLLEMPLDPLALPSVAQNPADRCYHCKRAIFTRLIEAARGRGFETVVDGSNADDALDYRPGMRALRELGVFSPLLETGWHKDEERALLRAWGHEVWSLPAGACLATRIPCGEALTPEKLAIVRACEDYLHELGLEQVRVRLVNGCASVTATPQDLFRLRELGNRDGSSGDDGEVPLPSFISEALVARGAASVEDTARAYRSGAMNAGAMR